MLTPSGTACIYAAHDVLCPSQRARHGSRRELRCVIVPERRRRLWNPAVVRSPQLRSRRIGVSVAAACCEAVVNLSPELHQRQAAGTLQALNIIRPLGDYLSQTRRRRKH